MNNLVVMKNQQAVTTSLQVAEVFGKSHRHVLEAIDELKKGVAENWADLFYEDTYVHPQNKQTYRQVIMNRDGFTLLAMGFTGQKALQFKLQYIDAFNQMEDHIKHEAISVKFEIPQSYSEALRLAADQQDQLEKQKPIVEYTKTMLLNPGLETTTAIAKNYGMGAKKFNNLLHELGIQYRQGKTWFLYAKYQDKGYTHVEPFGYVDSDGMDQIRNTSKWTQKGQEFIYQKLKEVGISPTIEDNEEA